MHYPRGFSFTEILFAVMILGIGFIMVAAMFPVAIHQTESNNSETISASLGRAGYSYLSQVASREIIWPPVPVPPNPQASPSSVLLPTVPGPTSPAPIVMIPPGTSSLVQPGQVWSFNDSRDTYGNVGLYSSAGGAPYPILASPSHTTLLMSLIAKNMIQATDPRFAWAALYKRDLVAHGPPSTTQPSLPASSAQVFLVGVQSHVKPAYDPVTDVQATLTPPSPLVPTLLTGVSITAGNVVPVTVTFPTVPKMMAENAYLIVSTDGITATTSTMYPGMYNGRVYRIGLQTNGNTWTLIPGQAPGPNDPALGNASVFVVGRSVDPNNPGTSPNFNYAGTAQDVTVYSTFVQTP